MALGHSEFPSEQTPSARLRRFIGASLLTVALARAGLLLGWKNDVAAAFDDTFLLMVGVAVLILFVPIERMTSFKTDKFEFTLEKPAVQQALAAFPSATEEVGDGRKQVPLDVGAIKATIERLDPVLPYVRGSRILWIDDKPWLVREERRLLRALGVTVVAASSTARAREILADDLDFDVVVSDAKRRGEESGLGAGAAFFRTLRRSKDPHLASIPFVFYSALDAEKLRRAVEPSLQGPHPAELSGTPDELLTKVVKALLGARVDVARGFRGKKDHYRKNFAHVEVLPAEDPS